MYIVPLVMGQMRSMRSIWVLAFPQLIMSSSLAKYSQYLLEFSAVALTFQLLPGKLKVALQIVYCKLHRIQVPRYTKYIIAR